MLMFAQKEACQDIHDTRTKDWPKGPENYDLCNKKCATTLHCFNTPRAL